MHGFRVEAGLFKRRFKSRGLLNAHNLDLAALSRKRHVLILLDVLQTGGGAAPPPTPPLIFIAPHSQARPSSAEQETTWRYFFNF